MKPIVAVVLLFTFAVSLEAQAQADPWRSANEAVEKAGGWKAYAREIHAPQGDGPPAEKKESPLSLEQAIASALSNEIGLREALAGIDPLKADYLRITAQQREALTRRARIVADVQGLYITAVASHERLLYQEQVLETASITAELAARMQKVGNLNALHRAEEELSMAKASAELLKARQVHHRAREALIQRLKLAGRHAQFVLAARLPALPDRPMNASALEDALMKESSLEPPLADRVSEGIVIRSSARVARDRYRQAYALARHYQDEILPLRRRISQENLLRYNGMIIGVFELLTDAKHQIESVQGYLNALEAYWQAHAEFQYQLTALKEYGVQFRRDTWPH